MSIALFVNYLFIFHVSLSSEEWNLKQRLKFHVIAPVAL